MKSAVLFSALGALFCGTALAADLPTRKAPPAPMMEPAPAFNWMGVYVGVNAGYAFANNGATSTTGSPAFQTLIPGIVPGSLGTGGGGFIGGGQIGYNWQFGQFVPGVEADIDYVNQNKTASFTGTPVLGTQLTTSATRQLNYLGTLRARLGYTPMDRTLFYVTGGLAYGGVQTTGSVTGVQAPALAWNGSTSSTRVGYALGAGGEYAITNNIALKLEYLYYDLGTTSFVTTGNAAVQGVPALAGIFYTGQAKTAGSILRTGLDVKF